MSAVVGWLWWWVLPVRKRLAIESYRHAFPDRDPRELRRTVGDIVMGYLALLVGVRAEVRGAELAPPGGGIALAGHFAAWDLALASAARQIPVTIFVRPPKNRLAAWWVERLRRASGTELLPPHGSMAAAYDALARGRLVVFVQDQRHNSGIAVPFFGRPALTSPAFAAMAHKTRAPLFAGRQWKDEMGHHIELSRLDWSIPEDKDEAIRVLTERSQQFYEETIRVRPWSWLWLHDRWKGAPG